MLIKPVYELLPFTYLGIGGISILLLEQNYAIAASIVVFFFGARIYNLRSQNRRTDHKRRRKTGIWPDWFYGFIPFIYIISAAILYRFYPKGSTTLFALCLVTFGVYLLLRRSSYRHHKMPAYKI
ncbi:hypothetical protein [Shewanella aestuarii]|uniref:Uncharacterized protein n=1 Tax=Shewanella aestuarii TaxID=1028752 RepID=A0A6G9QN03_9GAMM|nr:hypothetical protein [Shewanella aestuarii]QIR15219.1 hypothetical protein HBH39_12595 [Shewanella aestuarii]